MSNENRKYLSVSISTYSELNKIRAEISLAEDKPVSFDATLLRLAQSFKKSQK